jgi:hypothetical protein
MVPGFLLSAVAIVLVSRLTQAPSEEINVAFSAMEAKVKTEL